MSGERDPQTYEIGGGWGNSIQWMDVKTMSVYGFKDVIPKIGDLLESKMQSGKIGVFRFVSIDRKRDPPDMFFGTVEPVSYKDGSPLT